MTDTLQAGAEIGYKLSRSLARTWTGDSELVESSLYSCPNKKNVVIKIERERTLKNCPKLHLYSTNGAIFVHKVAVMCCM